MIRTNRTPGRYSYRHAPRASAALGARAALVLAMLLLLVPLPTACAQATGSLARVAQGFWVGAGGGLGSVSEGDTGDDNRGGAVGVALFATYRTDRHLVTARLSGASEVFGDTITDYGLLYGRVLEDGPLFMSAGLGVAIVDGVYLQDGIDLCGWLSSECERDKPTKINTVGVPVEMQLFWRPLRFVGIGGYAYANLSSKGVFGGLLASIQIGALR